MPNDQPTRRLRFSLKQLFLLVALIGVGFGAWHWLTRKVVVVRAATAEDKVFGDENLQSRRNVAVVAGRFMKGTSLLAKLYLVQSGVAAGSLGHVVGRLNEKIGGKTWESVTLRLALGENLVYGGRVTDFYIEGIPGEPMGSLSSATWPIKHNIKTAATKTLPGKITPGRPHIVYVEGDQAIVVDGTMTVEEFATVNPGNYLVVTVEIR